MNRGWEAVMESRWAQERAEELRRRTWAVRVRRVAARLDVKVLPDDPDLPVLVRVEDLERLADEYNATLERGR